MARFNTSVKVTPKARTPVGVSRATPDTVNKAGGEAYSLPLRHAVVSLVLNSMLSDRFYTSAQGNLEKLQETVAMADKAKDLEFVAKAAMYARKKHGLRTVSHVLAGEIGDLARGSEWKRRFYASIADRPDDICEILAYWLERHPGVRHPNAMIRGFAQALPRFTGYALAKYSGRAKTVNLMDAVNICHPRTPKDHPIHALMTGTLPPADTWEVALSKAGKAEASKDSDADSDEDAVAGENETKAQAWARLLSEKKLGYIACLRNLRNIATQAPEAFSDALALLVNEKAVLNSRVFPFQFLTAYEAVADLPGTMATMARVAISKAVDISLGNIPKLPGKTLIVVDDSGSMTSGSVGTYGGRSCIRIAALFAAALVKALPDHDYMQFSTDARYIKLDTVGRSVLSLAEGIEQSTQAKSTEFVTIFVAAAQRRTSYARIIILSDMQGWGQSGVQDSFALYAKAAHLATGKVPKLFSFDLTGDGSSQFPSEQVCLMAGFSDKVFSIMGQLEVDRDALLKEIDAVQFTPQRVVAAIVVPSSPTLQSKSVREKLKAKRAPKGEKSAKARRAVKLAKPEKAPKPPAKKARR